MAIRPKRIIWITTDHMRYDCIGAYGNDEIVTPNLDTLAKNGVNFHGCYCQSPLCMPSRASFMTGQYPQTTGLTCNGYCLPEDYTPTAATAFNAAGFITSHIGKMHLEPHEDHDMSSEPRKNYGFDTFAASESRGCYHDAWMTWLAGTYPEYVETFRITRPTDPRRQAEEKNGVVLDAPWQASQSGWIVDTACRYLGGRKDDRVFMHLGFHNPHPPLNPTAEAFAPYRGRQMTLPAFGEAEWEGKSQPLANMLKQRCDWTDEELLEYKRYFYALVTEVDLAVGYLVDWLRQQNLLEDTLLVFTSDHGDMCGNHRMTHKSVHFFDEVMHVPLLMHWPPGFGQDQRDCNGLVELVDLLPTLLGLSEAHIPGAIQGHSWAEPLLNGDNDFGRDSVLGFHAPDYAMLQTDRYKYIRYLSAESEVLFDLRDPEREVTDYAGDPDRQKDLQSMRMKLMDRLLEASHSTLTRKHRY